MSPIAAAPTHPWHQIPIADALWDVDTDPHLLAHGPSGCGKTTLTEAVLRHAVAHLGRWAVTVFTGRPDQMGWVSAETEHRPDATVVSALSDLQARLYVLDLEMRRRMAHAAPDVHDLPAHLLVIDDLNALFQPSTGNGPYDDMTRWVDDTLTRILINGGAVGIHVAATVRDFGGSPWAHHHRGYFPATVDFLRPTADHFRDPAAPHGPGVAYLTTGSTGPHLIGAAHGVAAASAGHLQPVA